MMAIVTGSEIPV